MAWEKRRERSYYYRTVRQDGKFKRLYYGAGPVGNLAAQVDALRMAERRAEQEARRAAREQLERASALTVAFHRECEMLAAATLLLAGFHRSARHFWRRWRHGRRIIRASG
jgi:hypothetical protein